MARLNHVKLIVPVVDIAHIEGAVADIIRIKDCLKVDGLDVEIQVAPGLSGEFSAALNKAVERLRALSK